MKRGVEKIVASKFWWLPLLIILFAVNYLASVFHTRFDLTKEKRYTLSKVTKDLLKNLDDDVKIDVFLKGEFPANSFILSVFDAQKLMTILDGDSAKRRVSFASPLLARPISAPIALRPSDEKQLSAIATANPPSEQSWADETSISSASLKSVS